MIKRTLSNGEVVYGKDQGYGRTAWNMNGQRIITHNQSSFGGWIGGILAGVGAGMLLGSVIWPPDAVSAEEEEELRQQIRDSGGTGTDTGSIDSSQQEDDEDTSKSRDIDADIPNVDIDSDKDRFGSKTHDFDSPSDVGGGDFG